MTDTLPKVSVVCAWYNRADYIHDTIDSLLTQDYSNFDITVVNDGSPDPRVREILDSYDDSRLRVIHQENTGFTRAIRRAIDESNGEYIAIQGAGDVSLPGRLSAQVVYLKERPSVVAVGSAHYTGQPHTRRRRFVTPLSVASEATLRHRVPFTQGTVIYRRSAYVSVGGYDVFFKYSQDWDFYFRLIKKGEIHGLYSPLYVKHLFEDGASVAPDKKIEQYCYARVANLTVPREAYFFDPNSKTVSLGYREEVLLTFKMIVHLLVQSEFRLSRAWILHLIRNTLPVSK